MVPLSFIPCGMHFLHTHDMRRHDYGCGFPFLPTCRQDPPESIHIRARTAVPLSAAPFNVLGECYFSPSQV